MSIRNSRIRVVLSLFVVLLLTGTLPLVVAQDDGPFRVAVVTPSATNDLAFSQSIYDALVAMQEELGEENFTFDIQDGTFIVDDAAVALREWAASGDYDLIIAHGSQYGSILEVLAPEFPDTPFAWGTDNNTFGLDNIFAYEAASHEGGFINGAVSGLLTETGVVGVVGPIEVGDAKLYVDGFVAGVLYTNPDATVNVTYIQSFGDVPLATEAAETHVANDADIMTGTAQMVVGAISVARDNDVLWFGTQASQADLAGEIGIMFQIYHWEVVLFDIMDLIAEGQLGGIAYEINLENGGLVMEINAAAFEDEEAVEEFAEYIEELIEDIISGEIVIFPEDDEMEDEDDE
jgi:basic membrane lipoprotein Med (substrate-binding protein (PBP1-ABC) superfamily)